MESVLALKHAQPGEVVHLGIDGGDDVIMTRAIVRTPAFEAIQLVVRAGTTIAAHQVSGHLTLQCLAGSVELETAAGSTELLAGDWLYLEPGARHSLRGVHDCKLLLTIMFDGDRE